MKKIHLPDRAAPKTGNKTAPELPGHPINPPGEDVFSQWSKVREIAIEDAPEFSLPLKNGEAEKSVIPDFTDDVAGGPQMDSPGAELDVPGSELDDAQEKIGSEDEENNYYSRPD